MSILSLIPLMPPGLITFDNIYECQKAGSVAFCIWASLINTNEKISNEYLEQLIERAHRFIQAVSG